MAPDSRPPHEVRPKYQRSNSSCQRGMRDNDVTPSSTLSSPGPNPLPWTSSPGILSPRPPSHLQSAGQHRRSDSISQTPYAEVRSADPPVATPAYPFPHLTGCKSDAEYRVSTSRVHRDPSSIPSPPPASMPSPSPSSIFVATNSGASALDSQSSRFQPFNDRILSPTSTPGSALTFTPRAAASTAALLEHYDFPSPNLYDLILMLNAEPGLDSWWHIVVQICTTLFHAERVTLAVPADLTDIHNVPWGLLATSNPKCSPHLGSLIPSPASVIASSRPSLVPFELSRQQKETRKEVPPTDLQQSSSSTKQPYVYPGLQALDHEVEPLIDHVGVSRVLERCSDIAMTRTYPYQGSQSRADTTQQQRHEDADSELSTPRRQSWSLFSPFFAPSAAADSEVPAAPAPGTSTRNSYIAAVNPLRTRPANKELNKPPSYKYEEYEQAPASTWSVSPSPSPAVRADPNHNPFFSETLVDESSFSPDDRDDNGGTSAPTVPPNYSSMPPPEAIGVENSLSILHFPLLPAHAYISTLLPLAPSPTFKLDGRNMKARTSSRSQGFQAPFSSLTAAEKAAAEELSVSRPSERPQPLAILSILSPIIPYPLNLRQSLVQLAPHLATAFSLCRHHTRLETELAGVQRRRHPRVTDFGDVEPSVQDGRLPARRSTSAQYSSVSSITSPSEHSAPSRSTAMSMSGTPGVVWDRPPTSVFERPGPWSPTGGGNTSDCYFGPGLTDGASRPQMTSGRERHSQSQIESWETLGLGKNRDATFSGHSSYLSLAPQTHLQPQKHSLQHHQHTQLHTFGANFESTFHSLPPSSIIPSCSRIVTESDGASINARLIHNGAGDSSAAAGVSGANGDDVDSRTGSDTRPQIDSHSTAPKPQLSAMLPPSDRLKGLMLDTLPAHVFVASPHTGEIAWVNSRYLSYRGQTATDLTINPWGSIHRSDLDEYLRAWTHSLRTGEQFSRTVRIRRFDGAYRWFYARAVASRDRRGVITQFIGSYMDIHDQRTAEIRAARQEEVEASEAKHRLLANLIPQIIFTATEEDGITFANEQWLSYSGQSFDAALGLGFIDFVHPDDLARCCIRLGAETASLLAEMNAQSSSLPVNESADEKGGMAAARLASLRTTRLGGHGEVTVGASVSPDILDLARKGVVKVVKDSLGRPSYTTELRLRSRTGEYRWHLVRCVEIDTIDFGSGASSYFGSATDINDHKLLEAKLQEAMESKSRFLSNMSHEIRTPLIGISGMVSFLQDTPLSEDQRDYASTIHTSASSLLMIINDILDLSKMDAGMMKLNHEWFHTGSLVEDVNELVSAMAIAKKLELNYIVDEDVPVWVKGDAVRLRQILLNIIGNAIKFTTEGEVFSHCRVLTVGQADASPNNVTTSIGAGMLPSEAGVRTDAGVYADVATDQARKAEGVGDYGQRRLQANEIMLEFAIIDTGRGFSEEEAELIFKPFSQIDGSSTRQHGGSGLGLVISRQLVELHGGRMYATAKPGKGSTFTFTACFGLPSQDDNPNLLRKPGSMHSSSHVREASPRRQNSLPKPVRMSIPKLMPMTKILPPQALSEDFSTPPPLVDSPLTFLSPTVASSASSDPSVRSSALSHLSPRSSMSSVGTGLARFSEAAKASGQDLSQMRLELPSGRSSPGSVPGSIDSAQQPQPQQQQPPSRAYSILIVCPQMYSRSATAQHIGMILSKEVEREIKTLGSAAEAQEALQFGNFSHVVLNLPSATDIITIVEQVWSSNKPSWRPVLIVLSESTQRQAVQQGLAGKGDGVIFVHKPVKPSRLALIFDPNRPRDLSVDRNRSMAQWKAESQKHSYEEISRRIGNRGMRMLLVEDNPVNQKVLRKFMAEMGMTVEIAADGIACTELVFSHPHEYFSLILCDLHMPRKDGYQACREIRQWEKEGELGQLPIIALSANTMTDVKEKCVAAGFDDYVAKPVDFVDLGKVILRLFAPEGAFQ